MEDKIPLLLFTFFLSAIVALLTTVGVTELARYQSVLRAIEAGADPLAARCAFESSSSSVAICAQVAARRQ